MSSLQRRFGLLTCLTPSVCHAVLLIVHLLSFIRAMCPAHSHFVLVTYWTMSVTLVLCPMAVLRILSFSLTLTILLSIARWLVSSFFTNAFVKDHVWHPCVIAGKTHWLKTILFRLTTRHPIRRDRTAHQLRQTLKGRDQDGHHESEKWEGCRTGRDTSRSHQTRHRDSCQDAIQPLQQDLGEGGSTVPVERRNHHQAAKKDLRDCSNYRGIMLLSTPGKVLNRVLLERMKEAVDPKFRDQQAGFRRNRSCADQIVSLRMIMEQSLECNSPLYINFIDYEKAFDSVDRETVWKLLRHYGVPEKIISLIRCTYQDMSCRIAHAGQLCESFEVKTEVRQRCLLSPFLFLLVIDWIMKTTTRGRNNGIQWTLWTQLDDLDFAGDMAVLSHNHSQM